VNADVYPDIATGLAAVADGEQFQVVDGVEIIRYRRDGASTATQVASISSSEATSPIAQNRRISAQGQAEKFTAGEVIGPLNVSTGGIFNDPSWTVDSNGNLVVSGDQTGTVFRAWDVGKVWLGFDPVIAVVSGEWDSLPSTTGPSVSLGAGAESIRFLYGNNGSLGVYNNAGGPVAEKGGSSVYSNIAFSTGEKVTLTVLIRPDGTGYMIGEHENGQTATHEFHSITERGMIGPAARRAAAFQLDRFKVDIMGEDDSRIDSLEQQIEELNDRVVILESSISYPPSALKTLEDSIVPTGINHILFYGQSNSIGADAVEPISLTQPYSNVTFDGGPRAWASGARAYLPLIPLAETRDDDGGGSSSSVPLGETPCSGAANYASTMMAISGIDPSGHVILASTAGRGSYRIDQLEKGTTWYNSSLIPMINAGASLGDYSCSVVAWIQGERDADLMTDYSTYKSKLVALQSDIAADVLSESGQDSPTYLLVAQICSYAQKSDAVARAQFDAPKENSKIFTILPTYRIPYGTNIHFSAAGAKLAGAYFGRAYEQMLRGYEPDSLRAVSATVFENRVTIAFDVPHLPLVLDDTQLAPVEDYGFSVLEDGIPVSISDVGVTGNTVIITLDNTPSGQVDVRYGLDHSAIGRSVSGGLEGCGNLRDNAPETIVIAGTEHTLFNAALSFSMTCVRIGY